MPKGKSNQETSINLTPLVFRSILFWSSKFRSEYALYCIDTRHQAHAWLLPLQQHIKKHAAFYKETTWKYLSYVLSHFAATLEGGGRARRRDATGGRELSRGSAGNGLAGRGARQAGERSRWLRHDAGQERSRRPGHDAGQGNDLTGRGARQGRGTSSPAWVRGRAGSGLAVCGTWQGRGTTLPSRPRGRKGEASAVCAHAGADALRE
jgi:hypothetical protein